ncbi:unnamed protein product [Gordionus sp. m RMFG-2023]
MDMIVIITGVTVVIPDSNAIYNPIYFYIAETQKKCFIEEIPDETRVEGIYKIEVIDPQTKNFIVSPQGIGMHIHVNDPDGKTIMSKLYSSAGQFSFTSETPGEHVICLHSNSTRHTLFERQELKVYLRINIGEHTINYAEATKKEKYTELELRIRQLLDQLIQIAKEQNYQRVREEKFRKTSESTNQRVLWWSISQIFVLVITGVWQMKHLKSFFEAKKLV